MIPSSPTGGLPPKRRLECKTCQRTFHKTEHLKRHERSHTGLKPFVCQVCTRAFSRHDSLIRHDAIHVRKGDSAPIRPLQRAPPAPMLVSPVVTHDYASRDDSQFTDSPVDSPVDFHPLSDRVYEHHELHEATHAERPSQWPAEMVPGSEFAWPECKDFYEKIVAPANASPSQPSSQQQEPLSPVFLDRCLVAFFEQFLPSFPIFPKPSYPFQEHAPSVMLSVMAVGSLYVGTENYCDGGEALWRQAHSTVQHLQQFLATQKGPTGIWQDFQLIATSFLCRIYGTLSSNPQIRASSAALSGSLISKAHQEGLLNGLPTEVEPPIHIPSLEIEAQMAKKYSSVCETCSRVLSGCYIVDGLGSYLSNLSFPLSALIGPLEISVNDPRFDVQVSSHIPFESHQQELRKLRLEEIFYRLSTIIANGGRLPANISILSLHAIVSHIHSLDLIGKAAVKTEASAMRPSKVVIQQALFHTKELISSSSQITDIQRLDLLVRWHVMYMSHTVDILDIMATLSQKVEDQLPSFVSAANSSSSNFTPMDLQAWSNTSGARVCLLHAIAIHDLLAQLPQNTLDRADPLEAKRSRASIDSQNSLIDPNLAAVSQSDPLIDPLLLQLEWQQPDANDSSHQTPSNCPTITPFSIHLPQSLLITCSILIAFATSLKSPSKVIVPAIVEWQDSLFADSDPDHVLGDFAKPSESHGTQQFVEESALSSDETAVEHDLQQITGDFRKMLVDLARWFPVAAEMENLVARWINGKEGEAK